MIIRSLVVLSALLPVGLSASIQFTEKQDPTISECAAKGGECDESRGRLVCGTDDQTYPSRCHLLRVQCSGHQVSLKYRGPCKACKEARDYALKHIAKRPPKFVPRCKPDGTYAPIQCLGDTGCWCSDITGKPIENTSVRTGKPKCHEHSRANIRRSPSRQLSSSRTRRSCMQLDRAAFNSNLIKVFQSEYARSEQQQQQHQQQGDVAEGGTIANAARGFSSPSDNLVLDWKFTLLDVNSNQVLDKNEFRELKKLVKRAVKPRRCGRAFGKLCDLNDDDRLSRTEWNNCISKDGTNLLSPKPESPLKESEGDSDCLADQTAALEEQKHGGTILYVPECTADGRYQRVQCYRSTPYCWCVHEDTGKHIPGTSVKDRRPQCDSTYSHSRPMKGCPEPRKIVFLKNLRDFLKSQVVSNSSPSSNATNWKSEDERILTLSFVLLDKNKNKVWERKEWKIFRELMTNSKTLRKCGKKLPRYCDVNTDKKITLSEWLNCLQTQAEEAESPRTVQSSEASAAKSSTKLCESNPTKLCGSNPLEQYLKE